MLEELWAGHLELYHWTRGLAEAYSDTFLRKPLQLSHLALVLAHYASHL